MPIVEQNAPGTLNAVLGPADWDVSPAPTVTVQDSLGVAQAGFPSTTIVHDGLGLYHYVWNCPLAQPVSPPNYDVHFVGYVGGAEWDGWDSVEVVAAGSIPPSAGGPTAVGTYATLAGIQARIGNVSAADATELQSFCDQTNAWIESYTSRVLAPLPVVQSTTAGGLAIGATSLTAATDISDLRVEDELAIGPVTGVHESSNVIAISGSMVTLGVPLANAYLTGAPLERVYLRDGYDASSGDDTSQGRVLIDVHGIVMLTALEIASYTRGPFAVIPPTDYWLRPTPQHRDPGWPATELHMTNIPSPTNPYPAFFPGYGNVRLWGVMGWPAMPTGVVGVAERVVAALWSMKVSGGAYSVTPGSDMAQQIPHLLSSDDWKTLERYKVKSLVVIG